MYRHRHRCAGAALRPRRQRGAVMAEAALVLPLLLLVVFATVELGRAVEILQTLDSVARQAARYSALPAQGTSTLPSDVATRAENWAQSADLTLTSSDVTVNQNVTQTYGGLPVSFSQVDLSYTYNFITPILSSLVPSVTLHGHALMRNETN